uniref:non-specific serine/threonine protein kinase n=1 Tax=Tanacetum cinerariifolium TaxID=118510 RepID=A0A6L2J7A4_TANCI|nr:RNA-directed DNA polymerase, eukaryota, reverse transcriptase zinc-binding domain protein [Tanacetum cinerariifolium]
MQKRRLNGGDGYSPGLDHLLLLCGSPLSVSFPRLYRLESNPDCSVSERSPTIRQQPFVLAPADHSSGTILGSSPSGFLPPPGLIFKWAWSRVLHTTHEIKELIEITSLHSHLNLSQEEDSWEFSMDASRKFTVKKMKEHIFVRCKIALDTWRDVLKWWNITNIHFNNLYDVIYLADYVSIAGKHSRFFDAENEKGRDPRKKGQLKWKNRFVIIDGIAQGLVYLHKFLRLRVVIHRDLKASNILLDGNLNPKYLTSA